MDEKKTYQVTYKVYHNERLKKVSFHGKPMYPLYIRLTYDRRTTEYRSNLFDLFIKPKYGIRVSGQVYPPPIEKAIQREEKLIEFIIDRHLEDFSLEMFKQEYDYYSQDLLDEMEQGFMNYLQTFFEDEGMPYLGNALRAGAPECSLYDIVSDMKWSFKPDLYGRLFEHSFYYAPPYLVLYQFAEQLVKRPLTSLILMEWEDAETKEKFIEFMKKYYPDKDLPDILAAIDEYMKRLMAP